MTRYLLIALLTIQIAVKSQTVPQGINYQAVIRNSAGSVATNSIVSLKFTFYNSSALTPVVYNETHVGLNTGPNGIVTCTIGMGTPSVGTFSNVAWKNGDVWYSLSMDLGNTTFYTQVGVAQKFMTVPYAFYAGMAPTTLSVSPTTGGTNLSSVGGNTVFIPTGITTVPPLSLNTTTGILTSGPSTNSVSLLSIPSSTLWANSGANLYPTVLSGNVGIGTNSPSHKLMVLESNANNANAAIYGGNNVVSPSNNSHGVYGVTNSTHTLSAGVYGQHLGNGSAIFGNKTTGTGNAGKFISTGSSINLEPAVYIENSNIGTVPALFVKSSNSGNTAAKFEGKVLGTNDIIIPATSNYKYSTPKTEFLSVSALAFNTEGLYDRGVISGAVYITNGSPGVQGNLYAPIQLPNTATITAMDLYVDDDDASLSVSYLQFWRQDGALGSAFGNPYIATTPGASLGTGSIEKMSSSLSTNNVVDNSQYCYFLRIGTYQSNPNLKIYKAVITYQIINTD